jgi:hypothetical protein
LIGKAVIGFVAIGAPARDRDHHIKDSPGRREDPVRRVEGRFFQPGIPCVWQVRGADRPADDDDDQYKEQRRFNVAIAVFLLNPRKKSDELTIAWRENRVAATLFVRRDAAPTAEKNNGPGKDIVGKLDAQIGIGEQNRQHADAACKNAPASRGV